MLVGILLARSGDCPHREYAQNSSFSNQIRLTAGLRGSELESGRYRNRPRPFFLPFNVDPDFFKSRRVSSSE